MRMYARAYECGQIAIRTHDKDRHTTSTPTEHTTGTHDHRKREDSGKAVKPVYICMIAGNEKKYKKVKKNLEIWKNRRIFVAVIKQQTSLTIKLQSNENN